MTNPHPTADAAEISVTDYTTILLWPLAARQDNGDAADPEAICRQMDRMPGWIPLDTPLKHARPTAKLNQTDMTEEEYAELVYFYPFIQSALYGQTSSGNSRALLKLYRQKSIDGLELDLPYKKSPLKIQLTAPRINLCVFQTGDVFLVIELVAGEEAIADDAHPSARRRLTLAEAQTLNMHLRRLYPPYFYESSKTLEDGTSSKVIQPAYSLLSLKWTGPEDKAPAFAPLKPEDAWPTMARKAQSPGGVDFPLLPHWDVLLPKLGRGLRWRQVHEDRMPVVASLTLDTPQAVSDADWVRLAYLEGPGTGMPYARDFLSSFPEMVCYDRFWDPASSWQNTRYLCSGYAFMQVLSQHNPDRAIFRGHLRTLYFQMALLSHFHQAALQNLSDRLAHASQPLLEDPDNAPIAARKATRRIMADILRFTQAYWFTDVSNQVQARELFALMRTALGVQGLYDQVTTEARETNAFLDRIADERQAGAAQTLNSLAAVGVTLSLALGFLGMNILVPTAEQPSWWNTPDWGALLLTVAGSTLTLLLLGLTLTPLARRGQKHLLGGGIAWGILFAVLGCFMTLRG